MSIIGNTLLAPQRIAEWWHNALAQAEPQPNQKPETSPPQTEAPAPPPEKKCTSLDKAGGFRNGKLGMHLTEFFSNPKGLTDLQMLEDFKKTKAASEKNGRYYLRTGNEKLSIGSVPISSVEYGFLVEGALVLLDVIEIRADYKIKDGSIGQKIERESTHWIPSQLATILGTSFADCHIPMPFSPDWFGEGCKRAIGVDRCDLFNYYANDKLSVAIFTALSDYCDDSCPAYTFIEYKRLNVHAVHPDL